MASEPRLSTRGEHGHAARGTGSRPRCGAKLRREAACSPRCVDVARVAYRHAGVLSDSNPAKPQWRGTNPERMEQATSPTRLRGCFPMPLTLQTLWAAAAIADPGAVEDAQTAIGFVALLSWAQRRALRTGQRPVALVGEVLPREPPRFPGQGDRRLVIALHRRLLSCGLCDGGSKLGRAQRRRLKQMPQFQTEVPDPLRDNLPRFLESRASDYTSGRGLAPVRRVTRFEYP